MTDRFKQHGAFSWNELMTGDPQSATDFYTKLLGWTAEDVQMEDMTYTVISAGDEQVGGIMKIPPEAQGTPPHWGAYITVDNVDETAGKAEGLGAKIIIPPRDIPNVGRFTVIQDPQGAYISLITYAES